MIAIAVFLLGLLAFLQADGGVSQKSAIILSVAAMVLAILALVGAPTFVRERWRRP